MKKQKNKNKEETIVQREELNQLNAVTQSVKPKNQNQAHNVKKEGIGRLNQMR